MTLREKACRDICAAHAGLKPPHEKGALIYIEANWERYGQEVDITFAAIKEAGCAIVPRDNSTTLDFVTRWLARLVDGETTEAECIEVLRHYPGPWENGRAMLTAHEKTEGLRELQRLGQEDDAAQEREESMANLDKLKAMLRKSHRGLDDNEIDRVAEKAMPVIHKAVEDTLARRRRADRE